MEQAHLKETPGDIVIPGTPPTKRSSTEGLIHGEGYIHVQCTCVLYMTLYSVHIHVVPSLDATVEPLNNGHIDWDG